MPDDEAGSFSEELNYLVKVGEHKEELRGPLSEAFNILRNLHSDWLLPRDWVVPITQAFTAIDGLVAKEFPDFKADKG